MKIIKKISSNYNERSCPAEIDTIILHSMFTPYSDNPLDLIQCRDWLEECGVSCHYLIDQEGRICQMIEECNRAWHAGQSKMPFADDKRENVNDFSIGIELITTQKLGYSKKQLKSLYEFSKDILSRHKILNFIGHSHVAVKRSELNEYIDYEELIAKTNKEEYLKLMKNEPKTDPWNFDWQKYKKYMTNTNAKIAKFPD